MEPVDILTSIIVILMVVGVGWLVLQRDLEHMNTFQQRCEKNWGACCDAYSQGYYDAKPDVDYVGGFWKTLPWALGLTAFLIGMGFGSWLALPGKKKRRR